MDAGAILGVTLIALLWLPVTYALHAPGWSAALLSAFIIGPGLSLGDVILAAPVAAVVCIYAEKWLVAHLLRLQVVAIVLAALSLVMPVVVPALTCGLALGLFFDRSLKNSLLLFRAAALAVFFLVVAIHPGFWGQTSEAHRLVAGYLAPWTAMILFAVATQIGSGVQKRARAARQTRLFNVAEQEIGALIGRIAPRDSQPA